MAKRIRPKIKTGPGQEAKSPDWSAQSRALALALEAVDAGALLFVLQETGSAIQGLTAAPNSHLSAPSGAMRKEAKSWLQKMKSIQNPLLMHIIGGLSTNHKGMGDQVRKILPLGNKE